MKATPLTESGITWNEHLHKSVKQRHRLHGRYVQNRPAFGLHATFQSVELVLQSTGRRF